ncbi:hypothetical protein K7432_012855 [Basidiobolus ranarum]|uniref:Alcohol dehydrogenase-like N-terminal domain-containing protein n=1 Tax=Basidiobolus ranarum TaxID=34480 RepID=A0ABR2WK89_9FUNG
MRVILQQKSGDVSVLEESTLPKPSPTGTDILVRNLAVSVNPVDCKARHGSFSPEYPLVLGWDGAGVVEAIGEGVKQYQMGDHVMYAGSLIRSGSNSQYTLVDEHIVGRKPKLLSFTDAAGLP